MDEVIKKYELTEEQNDYIGNHKVFRIKALRDFGFVKRGDIGGYVEHEENLSHFGNCWIYDNAFVVDEAKVYEDAEVRSEAWVYDNAEVFGNAKISGAASIYQYGKVYGNARVYDNARIYNTAQAFDNAIVSGNARLKGVMKASKPVTIIDNNEVVITISDDRIHVYQSKVYKIDKLPLKYRAILDLLDSM